ncbi:MAG TPA: hypothetical protein VES88_07375 [Gemmatimonadaceae bacterium]|nr:hypothetical protein [Gemmatimonadaceae bacterium]
MAKQHFFKAHLQYLPAECDHCDEALVIETDPNLVKRLEEVIAIDLIEIDGGAFNLET